MSDKKPNKDTDWHKTELERIERARRRMRQLDKALREIRRYRPPRG